MARYTHIFDSQWPEETISLTHYRDADNSIGSILAQIKAAQESGNYTLAQQIIRDNASALQGYVIDSSAINKYVEEIRNLEIYTKTYKQQVFYQIAEPYSYAEVGDVWIKKPQ